MKKIKQTIHAVTVLMLIVGAVIGISFVMLGSNSAVAEAAGNALPALNQKKMTVYTGKSCMLQMINIDKGAKVKWSASNKKVISVKADGTRCTVTGKKKGTATVTALYYGEKYTAKITVVPSVNLSENSMSLTRGESFTLTLQGGSSKAVWKASNKNVKLSKENASAYRVTGVKAGTSTVSVKFGGKNYKCKVTVKNPAPKLSKAALTLKYGRNSTVKLLNTEKTVKWSVKDKNIVSVKANGNSCKIIPQLLGNTYVYAKCSGKTYKVKVKVTSGSKARFAKSSYDVSLTRPQVQLSVKANSSPVVKWGIQDTKIAAVSKSGKITAKTVGTTKIYAIVDGKKIYTRLTVYAGKKTDSILDTKTDGKESQESVQTDQDREQGQTEDVVHKQTETGSGSQPSDRDNGNIIAGETERVSDPGITNENTGNVSENGDSNDTDPSENPEPDASGYQDADDKENQITVGYTYDAAAFPSSVTMEGGWIKGCDIFSEDPDIYFTVEGPNPACVDLVRTTDSCTWGKYVSAVIRGRIQGSCVVVAHKGNGEIIDTCKVKVTSTDTAYFKYVDWKKAVQSQIWTADMSDFEKVVASGQYLLDHYDYVEDNSGRYCFSDGVGGDCCASADLVADFAKDMGLEAKVVYANEIFGGGWSPTHTFAKVTFKDPVEWEGEYYSVWVFDATCPTADIRASWGWYGKVGMWIVEM